MTADEYRSIALSLPEAIESSHMNHPDFRVRRKVFATLWADAKTGVVKLTPEQQKDICEAEPTVFAPVEGGWGLRGATMVHLAEANAAQALKALRISWQNVAPRSIHAALDG